jgi:hypothetical protein
VFVDGEPKNLENALNLWFPIKTPDKKHTFSKSNNILNLQIWIEENSEYFGSMLDLKQYIALPTDLIIV